MEGKGLEESFIKTDFLSRATNGGPRKVEVARARAYFVSWAGDCRLSLEEAEDVERFAIRAGMIDHENVLASTAKTRRGSESRFFSVCRTSGPYNMTLAEIRKRNGLPSKDPAEISGSDPENLPSSE
jgi:hypothetical protein